MKARNLFVCAGMCLGLAGAAIAGDKPQPQVKAIDGMVKPVRVAPVSLVDGQMKIMGEWRDASSFGRVDEVCDMLWDAVQPTDDCTSGFPPIGGPECGIGEGSRWYFGTVYANPFSANDMSDALEDFSARAAWVFWWGMTSQAYVGILTSAEFISLACDAAVAVADGWVFDYGVLPRGFWYSEFSFGDGSADGWTLVKDGDGSNVYFLSDFFDGAFFYLATFNCHFGAWGTADDGGLPGRPGTNDSQQHDDDFPLDGVHTMPDECYYYDFGVCPDPLCNMMAFWGNTDGGDECYVDCNGDTVINSLDFLCFLNLYTSQNPAADCNGDTVINSLDFLCFLNLYNNPPCP
ncbi:MAG: hypothetical protein KJZ54_09865 [Phycisphaerales bacterium]|nr:hypothetical protein [Phycisphaerales bacterium]